jgi:DNA polymerase-3 subunit beta
MKFTIDSQALNTELSAVIKTVPKKSTIPVVEQVLIRAQAGLVTLYGTNLDEWLIATVPAIVEHTGTWAVNGEKFLKVVKSVLGQELIVEVEDEKIKFAAGKTKISLPVTHEEQYPMMAEFVNPKKATVGSGRFCDMIKDVSFAITKEMSRFTLQGAKLEIEDKHVRLVATDGQRLSFADSNGISGDLKLEKKTSVIVRQETLKLVPLLGQSSQTIIIEADNNPQYIRFKAGNRTLVSHLCAGNFPNYDMVLPKDNDIEVSFGQAELNDLIKKAAPFTDQRSSKVNLVVGKTALGVEARDGEDGEWSDEMNVLTANWREELNVWFNLKYLQDYLNTVKTGLGTIHLKDANASVEFRPVDHDYELRYVVIPLRS